MAGAGVNAGRASAEAITFREGLRLRRPPSDAWRLLERKKSLLRKASLLVSRKLRNALLLDVRAGGA